MLAREAWLRQRKAKTALDERERVVAELKPQCKRPFLLATAYTMPRMIDLIRASAVPASLMQSAARGALALPEEEMIEILVYIAENNKLHGERARMTLAGWDEKSSVAVASNPHSPLAVLQYMISPQNLRPKLLPALLENSSVSEEALLKLASSASREILEAMLASPRVRSLPQLHKALTMNPNARAQDSAQLKQAASSPELREAIAAENTNSCSTEVPAQGEGLEQPAATDEASDQQVIAFLKEHEGEIAAEEGKPFQLIGGGLEEAVVGSSSPPPAGPSPPITAPAASAPSPVSVRAGQAQSEKRGSALQKISRLDVKGRIQLAMKGSKEERSILIRDGTKIVALAVLDSPKLTDGEVETFANQKNVLEAVLRGIPMKRRFAKNYVIIRNLVFNPRTPLDVSLALIKNLLLNDLRHLASHKEVSETIRRLALKMFKQKMEASASRQGD